MFCCFEAHCWHSNTKQVRTLANNKIGTGVNDQNGSELVEAWKVIDNANGPLQQCQEHIV